jgi:hypothetical protein
VENKRGEYFEENYSSKINSIKQGGEKFLSINIFFYLDKSVESAGLSSTNQTLQLCSRKILDKIKIILKKDFENTENTVPASIM